METIALVAILSGAAFYLYRTYKKKSSCGGCCGCSSDESSDSAVLQADYK
ncbi:MAG: FeoB-associated Cys-rich membrane protein [SAR324 cluster bacterium]|nr:FeoB-associated Cys-rich membrane protein [SAR324 cluster bacterium]